MAISGVADSDILTIANDLGIARRKLADELGYSSNDYAAPTLALAASGSSVGTLSGSHWFGAVFVDWGDGTALQLVSCSASNGVLPSTAHTYAATGSYTATISGGGRTKQVTQTIT